MFVLPYKEITARLNCIKTERERIENLHKSQSESDLYGLRRISTSYPDSFSSVLWRSAVLLNRLFTHQLAGPLISPALVYPPPTPPKKTFHLTLLFAQESLPCLVDKMSSFAETWMLTSWMNWNRTLLCHACLAGGPKNAPALTARILHCHVQARLPFSSLPFSSDECFLVWGLRLFLSRSCNSFVWQRSPPSPLLAASNQLGIGELSSPLWYDQHFKHECPSYLWNSSCKVGWKFDKCYWRKVKRDLIMVVDRMRKDVGSCWMKLQL